MLASTIFKMRILCLHGSGASSEILRMQTQKIREQVGGSLEFEFIEGFIPCKGHEDLLPFFPPDTKYYSYFDPADPPSVMRAESQLMRIIKETGPYDGAMCFSQGCSLMTGVLGKYEEELPIRFAVFICGVRPFQIRDDSETFDRLEEDPNGLTTTSGGLVIRPFPKADFKPAKAIPSLHILGGKKDKWYEEGQLLHELWSHTNPGLDARLWSHTEGHRVPRGATATRKIVLMFKELLEDPALQKEEA